MSHPMKSKLFKVNLNDLSWEDPSPGMRVGTTRSTLLL